MRRPALLLICSVGALLFDVAGVRCVAADIPNVAFFGFQLINTSVEPITPADQQRIHMLDDMFRQELEASNRFQLPSIPDALQQEIASGPGIPNCNGCQRDYAKRLGVDWAAWGTVQKVSNLILNINVYMEDERSGKMQFAKRRHTRQHR